MCRSRSEYGEADAGGRRRAERLLVREKHGGSWLSKIICGVIFYETLCKADAPAPARAVDSPPEAAIRSNLRLPIASTALGSSSGAPRTILSQGKDMPTTIINLTVKTVEEKAVNPQNNQLGNMIAFSDDITVINDDPSLRGQHSGFYVRVRRPDFWLCEAGYILPGIPGTPFPNGGQLQTRGLLKLSSLVNTVAIIGGTEDYRCASGQVKIDGNSFELTIETP